MIANMILYVLSFLSAFLMFQLELIMAKFFLPAYGGSYVVWGACMVFFQALLLSGYIFADRGIKLWGIKQYRLVHLGVMLGSFLFFPGRALPGFNVNPNWPMGIDIFCKLLLTVGPAFFVLSTFSLTVQAILASSSLQSKRNPYPLYAVSNVGSMLGLLTYPFFFELYLDINQQLAIWRVGYVVLFGLLILAFKKIVLNPTEPTLKANDVSKKEGQETLAVQTWFLLGMGCSMMFLAVTTFITTEVAPLPLLWVIPLSIYLISFILNFKKQPWCPDWIMRHRFGILLVSVVFYLWMYQPMLPFVVSVGLALWLLFLVCMICQRSLFMSRPQATEHMTFFYVVMSLGSVVGSLLTSWVIPVTSVSLVEYPLAIAIMAWAGVWGSKKIKWIHSHFRIVIYLVLFLFLWPVLFHQGYHFWGLLFLWIFVLLVYRALKSNPAIIALTLSIIFLVSPVLEDVWAFRVFLHRHRNHYGICKVYENKGTRYLLHGTTLHGAELVALAQPKIPITYYHRWTPIYEILKTPEFSFKRIAVVGLGTGSLAWFGKRNQQIDFFEIDQDVYKMAQKYFSYLKYSNANLNFIFGDARLSLREIPTANYDVIIVDAFSSDAIPTHLLTTQMLQEYQRALKKDGMILFHLSNRYLDLYPVVARNALEVGAKPAFKRNGDMNFNRFATLWVAITWEQKRFDQLTTKLNWRALKWDEKVRSTRPWTDQYVNITRSVFLDSLIAQVKNFRPFWW